VVNQAEYGWDNLFWTGEFVAQEYPSPSHVGHVEGQEGDEEPASQAHFDEVTRTHLPRLLAEQPLYNLVVAPSLQGEELVVEVNGCNWDSLLGQEAALVEHIGYSLGQPNIRTICAAQPNVGHEIGEEDH